MLCLSLNVSHVHMLRDAYMVSVPTVLRLSPNVSHVHMLRDAYMVSVPTVLCLSPNVHVHMLRDGYYQDRCVHGVDTIRIDAYMV